MRKIDHLLLLLAVMALPILASSQTKRQLSLQDALQLAEENNLATKSAEARELAARGQYRMTNSVFLPGLTVSTTGVTTNDPLSSFGFKLKQEIVTQADFDPTLLNDPDRIDNFNTKLEVQQPLLNLDGIYARKAAKNQYEAMSLQTQRVKANIRYQVKKAYFMLELAQNAVGVLETSVKVAEDALKLTKDNEAQGFVKHADVLEAMVRVDERKNQLLEAQNNLQSANEFLAHLLGVDLNTPIETTDSMIQSPALAVWQASETTIEGRSDVQAIQKQIQGAENMLKSEKMKFVPRLNAFGAYEWNDSKLLGTSANNYLVGASLSWNLFGGYKNVGSAQHAKAQLQEAQYNYEDYLSQSQIQLNQAKRNVELKYQQVQSGKLAKEQATESFRIRNDRFAQGLEKTTELLMAEALSSQKNLEFIQAIYNYKEAVFQLELLLEKDINE
ncbi:TolC family protein [Mangrovibacterium diazotrophicum]|uniref:Outer membrane protein TolC n=1 Tax=Mangrovibacterium diazotrophicum TaxID=1261403 RepID=A0A419W9P8_9BACT|nr:TolC family protein [Mangrovibacterium diazotrophicum]RKD92190.1 outer membrane protein TolC [Mangrovibacterium diazotrophicum]